MTRKFFWRALEIVGMVSLIVGIVTAPFVVPSINNPLYRNIAWGFFIPLVIIVAMSIGLMPYFGMREMKNDVEKELANLQIAHREDTNGLEAKIQQMMPAYAVQQATEKERFRFITIEPYRGRVEKQGKDICLIEFDAYIRSWLFCPITIEDVKGTLGIGEYPDEWLSVDFEFVADGGSRPSPLGLSYARDASNCVKVTFRWRHEKTLLPAKYKDLLCYARILEATVTTREYGRILLTAIDGHIHLDWRDTESSKNTINEGEHEL